jgi:tight adherence protein B
MSPLAFIAVMAGVLTVAPVGVGASPVVSPVSVEIIDIGIEDHPQIDLTVTVTGLVDLAAVADDVVVTEDGQSLDVVSVAPATSAGMQVILLIDGSGSMSGAPIEAARTAAHGFVDGLPAEVEVGVIGFGSLPELLQRPTLDRAAVNEAIDRLDADGETALHDSVRYAVRHFSDDAVVRRLVLLSDGGDTVSITTLDDAIRATQDVTVDVIELVTNESNRASLDGLATDDVVRSVSDPALLSTLYDEVAASFSQQLVVTATSVSEGPTRVGVSIETSSGPVTSEARVRLPVANAPSSTVPASTTTVMASPAESVPEVGATAAAVSESDSGARRFIGAALVVAALALLIISLRSGPTRAELVSSRLQASTITLAATPARSTWRDSVAGVLERRDRLEQIESALRRAGMGTSPAELVATTVVVMVVVALVLGLLLHPLVGLLAAAVVPLVVKSHVNRKIAKRREQFVEQLPDVLQLIQSMLTSGFGLLQALKATSEQVAEPARSCFAQAMFAARSGRDISEALRDVADEMQSSDFDWVVTAIEINREIGGDLSTILASVAEGVRERQRLRGQVRALTAEGRLSAWIMLALPPGVLAFSALSNPEYVGQLFRGAGLVLLAIAITLMAVGYFWMRRMINKVMA